MAIFYRLKKYTEHAKSLQTPYCWQWHSAKKIFFFLRTKTCAQLAKSWAKKFNFVQSIRAAVNIYGQTVYNL